MHTVLQKTIACALITGVFAAATVAAADRAQPLAIQEQGSFAVGGALIPAKEPYNPANPAPAGQTLRGDHASVFYQLPVNARKHPLVFLHGAGQSSRTWETTPDGREGFQNIFLRRGFGVYLLDQPRRGRSGRATVSAAIEASPDEQFWFGQFRLGLWPDFFAQIQFPRDAAAQNQFFRQMTPNTGPYDAELIASAVAALFDKIGSSILVTHSQGCGPGWRSAMKNRNIRAIVAYEPGSGFVFPRGELPEPIVNASFFGALAGGEVPLEQFMALTRIPIIIYYGDNIPSQPSEQPHQDYWRACLNMARLWAKAVNAHGGDATVVHLPEAGIKGNTHFPFSDLNNLEVADHLSGWLREKKLD